MMEYLFFAAAAIGTLLAGWIDLKTTEIPDEIPLGMVIAGLVLHFAGIVMGGSWSPLKSSFLVGLYFLLFGYVLYYTGQWGEGDVLVLSAMGFLVPEALSFFASGAHSRLYPLLLLGNVFIAGGVYTIFYALAVSLKNPGVFSRYFSDLKAQARKFILFSALFIIASFGISFGVASYLDAGTSLSATLALNQTVFFFPAFTGCFLLYRFVKVLDDTAFKKKVRAKDLKVGDVLAENITGRTTRLGGKLWVGLEEDDIEEIRKMKKEVWIKEGIRFSPAMFLGLLATAYYGNLFAVILGMVV